MPDSQFNTTFNWNCGLRGKTELKICSLTKLSYWITAESWRDWKFKDRKTTWEQRYTEIYLALSASPDIKSKGIITSIEVKGENNEISYLSIVSLSHAAANSILPLDLGAKLNWKYVP